MSDWWSAADPGRVHTEGRMARAVLEDARASVASLLQTRPRQVVFTSGATEAINAATFGATRTSGRMAVALAGVEHSAVREASALWGSECVTIPVDGAGRIAARDVEAVVQERTDIGLVHCQLANHEVGTIQPVAEVADVCRRAGVMLHVDAAMGAGHIPVDFDGLGADLMSVSAHKMGGPAGIGALLVRRGLRIQPLIVGGAQERARRGGLENVVAAVGFGTVAAWLTGARLAEEADAHRIHTDRLRTAVEAVPGVTLYGPGAPDLRLPHLVCLGVEGVEAEPVLIGLDRAGVAAHSGSSCSSELLEPSPVLEAMGVDGERSLRLSVGWSTTEAEVDRAGEAFARVVAGLRQLRSD